MKQPGKSDMRLSYIFTIAATFITVSALCLVAARSSVAIIEEGSRVSVRRALDLEAMTWVEVEANGLQLFLAGIAPTEAERFKALTVAGTVIDASRVLDQMLIQSRADIAPPRFSVEILRNNDSISLIGLVPAKMDKAAFVRDVARATGGAEIADLLQTADYPKPDTWDDALEFATRSLETLPRTKISVDARRVAVQAMSDSQKDKARIETELARRLPDGVGIVLDISAPRPVITPFTLRFVVENGRARFDACSADTKKAQDRILKAASKAGIASRVECTIGLGVPSPQWAKAAELSIAAVGALGTDATLMIADTDIAILAAQGTSQDRFDDVIGQLDVSLPEAFALQAILPPPADDSVPVAPEFVATLSPEGLVQMRGRVGSELTRETVDSFARARFATDAVDLRVRVADDLPADWPLRVLTSVETLSYLSNGVVTVTPTGLSVKGRTGRKDASALIAGFLSEKLGEAEEFAIDVIYREALDPIASIPTPGECEATIGNILQERKIVFQPGAATVDQTAGSVMDDIADILKQCGEIRLEIGGHTDSQGREVMNQQLSQSRALAVLNELRARKVLTSLISAKGYGEEKPIANNDTEVGREANRRIEFLLIRPEPVLETETTLEELEKSAQEGISTSIAKEDQEAIADEQN